MHVPMLITHFLDRGVKLYGPKTCIVDGEKRFTYNQFGERVNRLSNALIGEGVKQGDRVAYIGPNGHRILESYYGIPQIGAILLCINIRLSPEEIVYILNHAGAKVVCVDWEYAHLVAPVVDKLETVTHFMLFTDGHRPDGIDWPDYDTLLQEASTERPGRPEMDENDVAELFYTSGTTSRPKGVMMTHRNIYSNAINYIHMLSVTDADTQLHSVPLFHVNGWGSPHGITGSGATHVIVRDFRAPQVLAAIQNERVTIGAMVPAMVTTLLNYPEADRYDTSSWERMIIGGAPVPITILREAQEKFGVKCYQAYGMTETCPMLTLSTLKDHMKNLPFEKQLIYRAKTGKPVFGVELRVVDEQGNDVEPNGEAVGEIIVRGNNVMKGFWQEPEETAKIIIDGWLHTGDIANIDQEGFVQIVDRGKDMIISGGENVASAEVEMAIFQFPAVMECAVVGVPDPKWGEAVKALVVLRPNMQATEQEIIDHCATLLSKFKLPRSVDFVNQLPKTGTGKILKRELRASYWAGHEKKIGG